MSRIAAGPAEGSEQGYRPYLQAALLMKSRRAYGRETKQRQ